ncbi:hypothetical protein GF068_30070 [Polyangium spumosum]|uniref:DUF2326 domain-containing protein n=2 Tax=Polyangium spumosum TaxID=889282 RepID=A0A6N7PZ39_9BACT|nr:hypothetical protein [Polyangium spumosum]
MQQLDLFGGFEPPAPPPPSAPVKKSRVEPLVWIAELWLLREYDASEASIIRHITLRKGLNVLWAPPAPEGAENRLGDGQITGHTAGKTTFCRMIRYLLGETRFGTARAQEKIREALPEGWVAATVVVGDARWLVGRPFGIGLHPFAVRGMSLGEALAERGRGGYQEFLADIRRVVMEPVPVKALPHEREPIAWEHVLPWVTRDQEARFAGLVEWRDPSSESESPRLVTDDRHVVVRALCALMSDEESEAQRRYEDLALEKQRLEETSPKLADRAAEDRRRLARLLEMPDDMNDAGPLFAARFRETVSRRKQSLAAAEEALAAQAALVEQAEEATRQAAEACGVRVEALREAEARREEAKRTGEKKREAEEAPAKLPVRASGVCSVPLDVAITKGCPLAASHAGAAPITREEKKALAEAVMEAKRTLAEARAAQKEAAAEHTRQRSALSAEEKRIARERAAIEEVERLFGYMTAAERAADENTDRLVVVTDEVKASSERQAALRREQEEAQARLSERFREVVRALLGDHVEARVEVKGRRLELRVEDRGERDGAAMQTIKLLAFDLAAMKLSVDGYGQLPGMLVHDGPREADMDGRIYERLFLYARRLEESADGSPAFQYVITTTAPPPKEMQKAPWLLEPLLDASKPEGRLLKMDL